MPTKPTYAEKLRDPRWQRRRLEILNKAEWSCQICYDGHSTLHVHHKIYIRGREPWEYDDDQLAAVCEDCHSELSGSVDFLTDVCSRLPFDGPLGRDDIGIILAALFCPDIETSQSFKDIIQDIVERGESDELRCVLYEALQIAMKAAIQKKVAS